MSDTTTAPAVNIVDEYHPMSRWTSAGTQWHRHSLTHAHSGTQDHCHILATDPETMAQLRELLDKVARGILTPEDQQTAALLLTLTTC